MSKLNFHTFFCFAIDTHVTPPVSRWYSTTWGSFSSLTGSSWCKTSCGRRRRIRQAVLRLVSAGRVTVALIPARPPPSTACVLSCQRRSRAVWLPRGPRCQSSRTAASRSRSTSQVSKKNQSIKSLVLLLVPLNAVMLPGGLSGLLHCKQELPCSANC